MTAKEMFEKEGFEELNNKNYPNLIMYGKYTPQHKMRITFDLKNKKISCACLDDTYIKKGFRMKNTPMRIDINLLKILTKQTEELGWE